jgi:hypothetical protein
MSTAVQTAAVNSRKWSTEIVVTAMVCAGISAFGYAVLHSKLTHPMETVALLAVTLIASRLKVNLPGVTGSMSVNLPFILLGAARLSMVEAVGIACLAGLVQSYPSKSGFQISKILFNTSNLAVTLVLTCLAIANLKANAEFAGLSLMVAGAVYMIFNTLPVAGVIRATEGTRFFSVWGSIVQMTFPYFALSAALATVAFDLSDRLVWQLGVAMLPIMALVYNSYRGYFKASTK